MLSLIVSDCHNWSLGCKIAKRMTTNDGEVNGNKMTK